MRTIFIILCLLPILLATGCGGGGGGSGGGGGGSITPTLPKELVAYSRGTMIRSLDAVEEYGPDSQLTNPSLDCDSDELCEDMVYTAQNFLSMGVENERFATLYVGSSFSHRGVTAAVVAGGQEATVAVMDSGFSLKHKAMTAAFVPGYDFLIHSGMTISTTSEEMAVAAASGARLDNPDDGVPDYFFDASRVHADDKAEFDDGLAAFSDALSHGTQVAGIIAAQRIAITANISGTDTQLQSVPGIAPGTKVIPFQAIGAVSVNWCTEFTGSDCSRSRPHLVPDRLSTFKRMDAVITLAKRRGAFAINSSLGQYGLPVSINLVNEKELVVAMHRISDSSFTTHTFAARELTIVHNKIVLFSPLLDNPSARISLSQAARNAITSGDGMAIVFAMGNAGYNDHNGNFFHRTGFRTKATLAGEVYDSGVHPAANFVFATDLSAPLAGLPGGEPVRVLDYGFGKEVVITTSRTTLRTTTRSLHEYVIGLWQFPGHASLKPYWLSVVGTRNITVAGNTVPEILPLSTGCGTVWERCIAAPGNGTFPTHDPTSRINEGYEYASGTSQAAPYVTGALALLKRYFPDLRADAATEILLVTADDLGDPGPDTVYGMGHLNIARALNPVGVLTATRSGATALDGSYLRTAGALAALGSADARVVGYDRYDRPFGAPLAAFAQTRTATPRPAALRIIDGLQRTTIPAAGGALHYRAKTLERFSWQAGADTVVSHDFCELECASDSRASWGFLAGNPEISGLTRVRHSLLPDAGLELEHSLARGRSTAAAWNALALRSGGSAGGGRFEWGLEIGRASEEDTLLGSEFGGAFSLQSGAATSFVHAAARLHLVGSAFASASFSRAASRAAPVADALITNISQLGAEATSFGLSVRGVLRRQDAVELEWEMPLQVTSGRMQLRTGGYDRDGQPVSGTAEIDLAAPARRSIWRLSYAAPMAAGPVSGAWLSAGVERRRHGAGGRSDADEWMYSLGLSWRQ